VRQPARLRIAVDARSALDPARTGIGHYCWNIVRNLPLADPQNSYIAWHLDPKGVRRGAFEGVAANLTEAVGRFPNRWFEPVSSRLGWPVADSSIGPFDVILATNFIAPATRSGCAVPVVHDIAFDVFPETAPHVDARWRHRFEASLSAAPAVIVPSHSTRDDLLSRYGADPARVEVVHHGVDAKALAASDDQVAAARAKIGDGPYLLFIGGIEPRKNLEALVRAFGMVAAGEPTPKLVIAGGAVRWFPDATDRLDEAITALPPGARARVIRTGFVAADEKAALLADAAGLVYPSLYEGFGFPVLEAFAAGVPVLTSNTSSMPEVAGDAALMVDPHDEAAIAEGMQRLLAEPGLGEQLVRAGLERVKAFTWDACARRTAAVLQTAAGRLDGPK
jgi:glycosyltransferase involved in cell wall biosynthesis